MKLNAVAVVSGLVVLMTAVTAEAQTKPRAYPVEQLQAQCIRMFSNPPVCNRAADVLRQRSGGTATVMQWNSGVGIVAHQRRQGKPI